MADLPISGLPDGGTIQPSDQVPVNRAGTTVRATGAGAIPDPITAPVHIEPATTDTPLVVTGGAGSVAANSQLQEWKADGGSTVMSLSARGGIFLAEVASGQALEVDLNAAGHGIVVYDSNFVTLFKITNAGIMVSLPTADPHVAGQLWSNSGVVTVSAG